MTGTKTLINESTTARNTNLQIFIPNFLDQFKPFSSNTTLIEDVRVVNTRILLMKLSLNQDNRIVFNDDGIYEYEQKTAYEAPFVGKGEVTTTGRLVDGIWYVSSTNKGEYSEAEIDASEFDWIDILTPLVPWVVTFPDTDESVVYRSLNTTTLTIDEIEVTGGSYEEVSIDNEVYTIQNLTIKDKDGKVVAEMAVLEDSTDYQIDTTVPPVNPSVILEEVAF